jgi:hypothetical protein
MLRDEEILQSINSAPLAQGPQSFVLAIGRAIERLVLERVCATRIEDRNSECRHTPRVAVPVPPGKCLSSNCECEPGRCFQREPLLFTGTAGVAVLVAALVSAKQGRDAAIKRIEANNDGEFERADAALDAAWEAAAAGVPVICAVRAPTSEQAAQERPAAAGARRNPGRAAAVPQARPGPLGREEGLPAADRPGSTQAAAEAAALASGDATLQVLGYRVIGAVDGHTSSPTQVGAPK